MNYLNEGTCFNRTIILPIIPRAQARHRERTIINKTGKCFSQAYKDPKQRLEDNKLISLLMENRPGRILEGPIWLGVKPYFPIPKSWSKKKREAALAGELPHTTKPDLDNVIKQIKDVMQGIYYKNDSQIVGYLPGTQKYYSENPHWEIIIQGWEQLP